jgi:hypothetical protein
MAFGGSFCAKESRRIEEIRDVHEQKFERFANNVHNIGGKHEIRPERGNMPINHIQLLLCSYRAYLIINVYYIPTYAQTGVN